MASHVSSAELVRGALGLDPETDGWLRPRRFTKGQLRAVGSCQAWHPGVYRQLAVCTAGVRLEFETDASVVEVELRTDEIPRATASVLEQVAAYDKGSEPPFDGVFAQVDGRRLGPLDTSGDTVLVTLDDSADLPLPGMGQRHHVCLWLPCLTGATVRNVDHDGTFLVPAEARDELLVIGDSLAQGYVAGDPSRTWAAQLASALGLDLLNQGLGGQVFQPGSLVGLAEALDPKAIIVELGENYRFESCGAARVDRDAKRYLGELSRAFPEVPTWVLTPLPHSEDVNPTAQTSCFAGVTDILRDAVAMHPQMRLVEGSALLDESRLEKLLADGDDHPNASGHDLIAERLHTVIRLTSPDSGERHELALVRAEEVGDICLPILECLRRGMGEVVAAEEGLVIVDTHDGLRIVWGDDLALVRQALCALGRPRDMTCVLGDLACAREVERAYGHKFTSLALPCHLAILSSQDKLPPSDPFCDIRVLTTAYAGIVRANYGQKDYLRPGELEDLLARGRVLGGFDRGRIVAFVGEHPEGSIGMLEVDEDCRNQGWGTALLAAKARQQIAEGATPWSEIWPENVGSIALHQKLGFTVLPADTMWFVP